MAFSISDFSWGIEDAKYLAHDSSSSPFDGERTFGDMISSGTSFGALPEPVQIEVAPDFQMKRTHHEQFPVGGNVMTAEATITITVAADEAQDFALALGATSTSAQTLGGTTYDTAVAGEDVPDYVSLMISAVDPNDSTKTMYAYAPRCQCTTDLSTTFGREDRNIELTFNAFASHQDGTSSSADMVVADGGTAGAILFAKTQ
jgi:hypothetical protein